MKISEHVIGARLATKDNLDAALVAFRWSLYRALFVQALCIAGMFAAALAYLR